MMVRLRTPLPLAAVSSAQYPVSCRANFLLYGSIAAVCVAFDSDKRGIKLENSTCFCGLLSAGSIAVLRIFASMLESMGRLSPQSLQPHKNKVNFCLSTAARILRSYPIFSQS